MENNFIQMVATAGHVVSYTIGPIFKHIIDYVQQKTSSVDSAVWHVATSCWNQMLPIFNYISIFVNKNSFNLVR